ncbi:MAG: hypothetical protein ABII64_08645 [Elusimicrobiota bacterium]
MIKLSHTIEIGTVRVCLLCPSVFWAKLIKTNYAPYLISAKIKRPDAVVLLDPSALKAEKTGKVTVSSTGGKTSISRSDFDLISNDGLTRAVLRCAKNKYSFDSWLRVFLTLLGLKKSSVLVHASGLHVNKSVFLFPGVSGSGKSSITRIFGRRNALSDEIVMLQAGKNVNAASTPFWGELKKGTGHIFNSGLRGVFFIKHGKKLSAARLTPGQALKKLLSTVLFFSKESAHVKKLLALAARISGAVPAYDLSFSLNVKRNELIKFLKERYGQI